MRALREEFDINEEEAADEGNELEEFVDMSTLRVLSVDMEGDIYNIALTCVVRLRLSLEEFKTQKGIYIDNIENADLKECTLEEIRQILLNYPNNKKEYHPATYLRLLMYHIHKIGVKETELKFVQNGKIGGAYRR